MEDVLIQYLNICLQLHQGLKKNDIWIKCWASRGGRKMTSPSTRPESQQTLTSGGGAIPLYGALCRCETPHLIVSCFCLCFRRIFERRYGSRKFASHLLVTWTLSTVLEVLCVLATQRLGLDLHPGRLLPPGPWVTNCCCGWREGAVSPLSVFHWSQDGRGRRRLTKVHSSPTGGIGDPCAAGRAFSVERAVGAAPRSSKRQASTITVRIYLLSCYGDNQYHPKRKGVITELRGGGVHWVCLGKKRLGKNKRGLTRLEAWQSVSQNWQFWVGNSTLWALFFHSPLRSTLWIFHSHPLKVNGITTTARNEWSHLSIYRVFQKDWFFLNRLWWLCFMFECI